MKRRKRYFDKMRRHRVEPSLAAGVLLLLLADTAIADVPGRHRALPTLLGRMTGDVLPEGRHLVDPFKRNNTP